MTTFNCYLIFSSRGCQEGKNFKVPLDKYSNDGNCLCINCCNINSINFDVIANRETIKLIKHGNSKNENEALFNELQLRQLEEKHKDFLLKLQ